MRQLRAAGLLLAALSLGSCSKRFPLDLVVRDGRLLVWTERDWRWFLIPHRPRESVGNIYVWTNKSWLWRVEAVGDRQIGLPVAYGATIPGATLRTRPAPLKPYVIYHVTVDEGYGSRSFRLSAAGELTILEGELTPPNPDELAFADDELIN